ncbi:MAG: hypothetical protein HY711_03780 [Candidatus Melainabacteria bacterium]|nr:hypothetical protein [Candidatus Melainabacteria bacterium]
MNSKTITQTNIRKSTFAEKLQKEIESRKTQTTWTVLLAKLNPFATTSK